MRLAAACLVLGAAALGGCSDAVNCSTVYRGGCVPAPVATAPATAAPASPVVVRADTAAPAGVSPGSGGVGYGDPATFADVDDKQCKSYGLVFGSHDYADCRIRLSAQHRGLDPNIGVAPAGPGSR
jgi:hypothetical protein